jgi:hypothetical protein
VLESAARKQAAEDRHDTEAIIIILEDKRAEVMARSEAAILSMTGRSYAHRSAT